jgi:hypothetical protein
LIAAQVKHICLVGNNGITVQGPTKDQKRGGFAAGQVKE